MRQQSPNRASASLSPLRRGEVALLAALLLLAGCKTKPPSTSLTAIHVTAASLFTQRYAQSRFAAWNVRAAAAGDECDVLLVDASIVLEDTMVDALHYGAGAYGVVDGGVQRFVRDRAFRGVAYKDSTGRIWAYGNVTAYEAERLKRCE